MSGFAGSLVGEFSTKAFATTLPAAADVRKCFAKRKWSDDEAAAAAYPVAIVRERRRNGRNAENPPLTEV